MQNTNYSVETSNETMKLEGNFSIDKDGRINYNVTIYLIEGGTYIGSANYCELEGNIINYNYNIPSEYKADVIALVDTSITDVKAND